ncbi:MAG: HDIG domain-containing metalloprotein [Acidimicrobiales bacterium]
MPAASSPTPADRLDAILMAEDVSASLWSEIDSGRIDELVPELPALRMEQDPIHRHKDVLSHTVAVVAKTPADLTVRLAALFHDIAKPKTRSFDHGGVTFRHHEAVGARMTKKRMTSMGYDEAMIESVSELVRMSGRFKGYGDGDGWSDAAVRRYAREAGPLLGRLNALIRSDCTTRNRAKAQALQDSIDDLERRIAELADADRQAAERPQFDGDRVMRLLGIEPCPQVGEIMRWLMEVKQNEGHLPEAELEARLRAYHASLA